MRWRDQVFAAVMVIVVAVLLSLPAADGIGRLSLDCLFWLRHQAFGPRHDPATSPTVVVAVDEETYRRPPFSQTPLVMWTPQIGQVLQKVLAGGPKIIGFDIILPTSMQAYLPGYERPFLAALHDAAAQGRIVLSKAQHQTLPIGPNPVYVLLAGGSGNVRSANVIDDGDGVVRRAPLLLRASEGGGTEPSFSLDLAARAAGLTPQAGLDGRLRFGENPVPGDAFAGRLVNFDGGPSIPTYSLADLQACADAGDDGYFKRNFAGKTVLFGTVLDIEDRRLTSKHWIAAPDGAGLAARCRLPIMTGLYDDGAFARDTIPGVYIQAQAINDLLRHEVPMELDRGAGAAILAAIFAVVALATANLRALPAAASLAGVVTLWTAAATIAFASALVLPWLGAIAGSLATFALMLGYRFSVSDRDKRLLRRGFSLFLPASEVDRLLADRKLPVLGGEERDVTIWFSDIAGFTALSEGMAPEALVALLNRYFERVTSLIEAGGGFVDKYQGDGVLAVFGAPRADPDHAAKAVKAALATIAEPIEGFATRIGLNRGRAVLGHVGSSRRFNYTVMGDAVNLASRLESANKIYGTRLLVSESVAAACGPELGLREIDCVRVMGRQAPVRIYSPGLIDHGEANASFTAALAAYQHGELEAAALGFVKTSAIDPVAAAFLERCRVLAQQNLPSDWDGVTNLDRKG